MSFRITFNGWDGYVLLEFYDRITAEETIQAGGEALQLVMQEETNKMFIDMTGINNTLSTTDLFISTKFHAEESPARPKGAMLGRTDQQEELVFIENVAVNRGLPIRTFTDREAAIDWLLHDGTYYDRL